MLNEFFKNIVNFLTAVNIDGETNINNSLTVLSSLEVQPNNSHTTLYVTNSTVGINTQFPNVEFTVNGEISSNKVIYDEVGNSTMWNSGFTSVSKASANWDSVYSSVKNTSSNWDSTFTSVKNTSANWDSVYTSVKNTSANWDSVYSTYNKNSADYTKYEYVNNNFLPLSGGTVTGITQFNNNVTIWGVLSATGGTFFSNTIYSTTSAISVVHVGSGPALYVGSIGTGDIASFYDLDQNIEMLHIGGHDGAYPHVGIKTSTPNVDFTVNGEISSNNIIYDRDGNSTQWNSGFTSINKVSANWDSVYTSVKDTSANWDSTFTSVKNTSANWDSVYSSVKDTSANWDSVYSSVLNTSGNWDSVYTTYNKNSSEYTKYEYVNNSFLPLSGGTVTGPVVMLSSLQAGSGNLTLNVKQNEVTVYGTISSNSVVYANNGNSNLWNSVYTSVKDTSGNWNSVYSSVLNTSGNWDSVYSTVKNASATFTGSLTDTLTSDLNVGAITAGQVFDIGTTFQIFAEKLITKVFYPTFTLPSATLTSNLASIVESGTTGITLTVNLNKGSIIGKSLNGIWQPTLFQNSRSGDATKYTIFNIDNGTTTAYTSANAVVIDGTNTFTATVDYDTGPQPVDSKNNNVNSPLASGSISPSLIVTGRRKAFYGINSAGSTSVQLRNLTHLLNPQNGTTFTISIPVGTTSIVFAYPESLRNVTEVRESVLNSDIKASFGSPYNVNVFGSNGYTDISYKVYRFQPPNPIQTPNYSYTVTI
jgi:hypothetical protein